MNDNDLKTSLLTFLFLNYGSSFTFDDLAKNVKDLDRLTAYVVLEDLRNAGHILRETKTRKNGKAVFSWGIDDSDEQNGIDFCLTYLVDNEGSYDRK